MMPILNYIEAILKKDGGIGRKTMKPPSSYLRPQPPEKRGYIFGYLVIFIPKPQNTTILMFGMIARIAV